MAAWGAILSAVGSMSNSSGSGGGSAPAAPAAPDNISYTANVNVGDPMASIQNLISQVNGPSQLGGVPVLRGNRLVNGGGADRGGSSSSMILLLVAAAAAVLLLKKRGV